MKNLRWLAALMGITIFAITAFQAYWLKNTYDREERTLEIKTNMAFRRTVQQLQASKLHIDQTPDSATKGGVKVWYTPSFQRAASREPLREKVVDMVGVLREKVGDSFKIAIESRANVKDTLFVSTEETRTGPPPIMFKGLPGDTMLMRQPGRMRSDKIFQFLYGVDSLQDSVRVKEIIPAYTQALKTEKALVPFTVLRTLKPTESETPVFNEVTLGFSNPVTFRLQLGNTFPYLLQKLTTPILISIFMVGVTILSFVLLYKNLLRQRRLAAIKNEFISNITHELKTPIATVGVAIEALKNFNAIHDPVRSKEYLDISANELQRLSLLVDKVLKLSMFENKEVELKNEQLSLRDIVNEVVSSMRLQFEKHNADIDIETKGNVQLKGDRLHLLSVVYNLLDNAVKYSNGSPKIKVELSEHNGSVNMMVSDNGIGIEPAYQEKVFEKFFRVPTGNTHNAKGYGLGLSYTAHVVRKHNGTIKVDSKPGEGSTFIVELPKNLS